MCSTALLDFVTRTVVYIDLIINIYLQYFFKDGIESVLLHLRFSLPGLALVWQQVDFYVSGIKYKSDYRLQQSLCLLILME